MSDNPFKSQPDEPTPFSAPPAATIPSTVPVAPGALTPILVFCLIFGIFGLLGSCMGGVGLAMISVSDQVFEGLPIPEEQKAFNKINMTAQQGALVPNIVLLVVNLVIAPMLIIGAIGCFKRKEPSRVFLRMAVLAAIIYSVLKISVTIFTYFVADSAIKIAIDKLKDDPMYDDIMSQYETNHLVTIGTIVVMVAIALAILGFYLWVRSYLNKSSVVEHFAAVASYKQPV